MQFWKIRSIIQNYFTFNSRERKGLCFLLTILLINIAVQWYIKHFFSPADFKVEEFSLPEQLTDSDVINENTNKGHKSDHVTPALTNLKKFDPNTIDSSTFKSFGFSEKQVRIFMNFREKGARFFKKEDMAKVYGITPAQYEALYPFIVIERKQDKVRYKKNEYKESNEIVEVIELNTADSIQLLKLPMIGSGRARMIVNYRKALGGYYNTEQLKEVYTVDSVVYAAIKDKVIADSTLITKMNLNQSGIKHPYISHGLARAIEAYRAQHGNFQHIEELKNLKLVDAESYNKLAPYLTIE